MQKQRILVVGALDRELSALLSYYKCSMSKKLQNVYPIWSSKVKRPFELTVLQTYVGDTNACIAVTLAITSCKPDYVFKMGCVGGSSKGLHAGEMVMPLGFFSTSSWITRSIRDNSPTSDASMWQSIYGSKPYQVNRNNLGGRAAYFEPDMDVGKKYRDFLHRKKQHLTPCFIGGGNIWFFDSKFASNTSFTQIPGRKRNRIWAADMESFAIAQTCHVFKKPFMGFYRVSDNYFEGERYEPEKVARLFETDYISVIDTFLSSLCREK